MIKYGYTILYVADVEKTVAFYVSAFGFTQKLMTPEKDYAELDIGMTTLAFASHSVAEYNGVAITKLDLQSAAPAFELAFVTEKVEDAFKQALENGAILVKELAPKPWGQVVGYVRDQNGFLIELCTPVQQ